MVSNLVNEWSGYLRLVSPWAERGVIHIFDEINFSWGGRRPDSLARVTDM